MLIRPRKEPGYSVAGIVAKDFSDEEERRKGIGSGNEKGRALLQFVFILLELFLYFIYFINY